MQTTSTQRSIEDEAESVRIAVHALGDMRARAVASKEAAQAQASGSGSTSSSRAQFPTSHSASSFQPTPALSIASSSTSPTLPSPSLAPDRDDRLEIDIDVNSPDFVSRVSHLPIVNSALRAYEQSKASSRVVKYGAEMMESSVKTISRPVMDRLPVNQLDEFACRQLDRLGRYSTNQKRASSTERDRMPVDEQESTDDRREYAWESGLQIQMQGPGSSSSSSTEWGREMSRERSVVREEGYSDVRTARPSPSGESQENIHQQIAQRSRWQTMLSEAGGLGAAVSEESMRRLKYCLQWLQYATAHIDDQILILRDFMASLQPPPGSSPHTFINPDAVISPEHMRQLNNVKRDVVDTVRQVVDVVSKYAGGALPEPARARVRGFILHLPQAWASASRGQPHPHVHPHAHQLQHAIPEASASGVGGRGGGMRRSGRRGERLNGTVGAAGGEISTASSSRPPSPSGTASPRHGHSRQSSGAAGSASSHTHAHANAIPPTAGGATQAAQRILTLATESLDMMRGVTGVVKDSLDRADAWVERLRIVGLQRQGQGQAAVVDIPNGATYPRPANSSMGAGVGVGAHRMQESFSASTSVASSPVVAMAGLPGVAGMLSPLGSASGSASGGAGAGDSYFGGSAQEMSKLDLGGGGAEKSPVVAHAHGPSRGGKKAMFADGNEDTVRSRSRMGSPVVESRVLDKAGDDDQEGAEAKRMKMDVDE